MIAIIDYGIGNLFSLKSSFEKIGENVCITADKKVIKEAERIILPGVGAFEDAARKLCESGLDSVVLEQTQAGKPLMGICLGMQMLFERSFEYGEHRGLGLIKGDIVSMQERIPAELKIPHMGWNKLDFVGGKDEIFKYLSDGDFVYFVHSYFGTDCDDALIATAEYGIPITAAVRNQNVWGCQFHPEKSGKTGLAILKAFCEI